MVGTWKTHFRYKTAFYLTLLSLLVGCADSTPYTIIKLHFKTAEQMQKVLEHAVKDAPEYKFSGQTILVPSDSKNLNTISAIIQEVDKPPSAYEIVIGKKNVKSYSTKPIKNIIKLVEGKTTVTQLNGLQIEIEVLSASNTTSLMNIISLSAPDNIYQKNHWIIEHNQHQSFANDIFPNGFILIKY